MNVIDQKTKRLGIASLTFLIIFLCLEWGGNLSGLMRNSMCYPILGCNIGFLGYDALVHFSGGVTVALGVLWISRRFPRMNVLGNTDWFAKNLITILAFTALIGVGWEMLEFSYDSFRVTILHMQLFHPNLLAQPTNADTMGDLTFGLAGAFIATLVMKFFNRDIL